MRERADEGLARSAYIVRSPPPLIAVNAFGDIELLPAPIVSLPMDIAEAA
jgi:hypothetical protein